MDVRLEGDWIVVRGRGYPEMKELGASWREAEGAWRLPASRSAASALIDLLPDAPDLRDALMPSYEPIEHPTLFDYQRDAAGRLVAARHGQIVVMSPGLGKTAVSVIAADRSVPAGEQVAVVAPASLLLTWEREIRKWQEVEGEVYVVRGAIDPDRFYRSRWIVMSWDKAARSEWGGRWPLVILDESVLAKSRRAKRTKALKKLRKQVDRSWLLSGSPVTKYADDLWAQLSILWPRAFKSYWRFAERYCVVEENPWAESVVGNRRGRDVMEENSDLVMVINQEDVLDLPEYLFEAVDVELGPKQAKAYEAMARDFIAELDGGQVIAENEIAKLTHLQQIASWWDGESAKHDALLEAIDGYEGPHLVWTHWREGAEALTTRLAAQGYAVTHVDGSTSHAERDKRIEAFKRGDHEVLVLSVGVGKFGHTLTNVKTVHWIDRTFNADDYFQALHRVRRIGLNHRPVSVAYRAVGTVDVLDVELNLTGKLSGISRVTKANLRDLLAGLGKETT